MKKSLSILAFPLLVIGICLVIVACNSTKPIPQGDQNSSSNATSGPNEIVVGFSQLGAESGWRIAETGSIKEAANKLGIELRFEDSFQKQENQIKSLESFIAQKVDVIAIAPVVETGWDAIFQKVKDAKIPLILIDRKAKVDESLYETFIGSDFIEEGKNAAIQMAALLNKKGNVVELQGTVGADPAIKRKSGFEEGLRAFPDIKITMSESGDFSKAKGKEVMAKMLSQNAKDIQGVYAHNDDMALGAIEAIKEANLKPGVDIKIVSIDGINSIFKAMIAGEANCTIECNPLLGPQLFDVAMKLTQGKKVDRWIKTIEGIFPADKAKEALPNRKY